MASDSTPTSTALEAAAQPLRDYRDKLREELVRVESALALLGSSQAPLFAVAHTGQVKTIHPTRTYFAGSTFQPPTTWHIEPPPKASALQTIREMFEVNPGNEFTAVEVNDRLEQLGVEREGTDPVNSVRGALSRLKKEGLIDLVDPKRRGVFRLKSALEADRAEAARVEAAQKSAIDAHLEALEDERREKERAAFDAMRDDGSAVLDDGGKPWPDEPPF